jgi:hypothetical protein
MKQIGRNGRRSMTRTRWTRFTFTQVSKTAILMQFDLRRSIGMQFFESMHKVLCVSKDFLRLKFTTSNNSGLMQSIYKVVRLLFDKSELLFVRDHPITVPITCHSLVIDSTKLCVHKTFSSDLRIK